MRITASTKPQGFSPIELKLTIESQEELDVLTAITELDMSIPDAVYNYIGRNRLETKQFLRTLRTALK